PSAHRCSAGVPLSSPAAAQRCAEGAGLDSGAPAAAQSAMPSIAPLPPADRRSLSTNAAAPAAPQLQSRISTSLTDVTNRSLINPPRDIQHRSRSKGDVLCLGNGPNDSGADGRSLNEQWSELAFTS